MTKSKPRKRWEVIHPGCRWRYTNKGIGFYIDVYIDPIVAGGKTVAYWNWAAYWLTTGDKFEWSFTKDRCVYYSHNQCKVNAEGWAMDFEIRYGIAAGFANASRETRAFKFDIV